MNKFSGLGKRLVEVTNNQSVELKETFQIILKIIGIDQEKRNTRAEFEV